MEKAVTTGSHTYSYTYSMLSAATDNIIKDKIDLHSEFFIGVQCNKVQRVICRWEKSGFFFFKCTIGKTNYAPFLKADGETWLGISGVEGRVKDLSCWNPFKKHFLVSFQCFTLLRLQITHCDFLSYFFVSKFSYS